MNKEWELWINPFIRAHDRVARTFRSIIGNDARVEVFNWVGVPVLKNSEGIVIAQGVKDIENYFDSLHKGESS